MTKVTVTYGVHRVTLDVPEGTTIDELQERVRKLVGMPDEVVPYLNGEPNGS